MMRKKYLLFITLSLSLSTLFAGNPDRQGEAGAGELLFNPWARSAGLHSLNISSVMGVEAMRLNVAGLGRISKTEVLFGHTQLYKGSELSMNAAGIAQKVGANGTLGLSLAALDFGEINVTTTSQPEGTGATYSPSFFHLGLGYAYTYENKISVGLLVRGIFEALTDVSASAFAMDAGVQYVTGDKDEFKLGISLRNIGSPMVFGGEALSFQGDAPDDDDFQLTFDQRAEEYELPSVLNIGISYDFYFGEEIYLRSVGNFTSNAFSSDQIGGGLELFFMDKFAARAGYRYDLDQGEGDDASNIYSGLAAGATVELPLRKAGDQKIGIDYAYRATNKFDGTHNFSLRLSF